MGLDSEVVCIEHLATDATRYKDPIDMQPAHLVDRTDGPARLLRHHGADQHHLGYW
jgi:hypothetical protein